MYQIGNMVARWATFLKKVKKLGEYIIYMYFMPDYISCQYNHLVVEAQIHLTKIKLKRGEEKRWKMAEADHDRIMETCIPLSHSPKESIMYMH